MDHELRILVVDDDRACRELHALCLEDHAVETAVDGQEALETLDERVDIVLLDRNMPRLSGIDAARTIDESDHDPYVVIVSSMEADFDLAESPVDGYLQKPASEEELRDVVDQYRKEQTPRTALDGFASPTTEATDTETRTSDAGLADSGGTSDAALAESGKYLHLDKRVTETLTEVDEDARSRRDDRVAAFRT